MLTYFEMGFYYGVFALGFISVFVFLHYFIKTLLSIHKQYKRFEELKNGNN